MDDMTSVPVAPSRTEQPSRQTHILSININSWTTFRAKWTSEGTPKEFEGATAILLQEHKLHGGDLCRDAEEWCTRRGWRSTFSSAATLPSGQPSGGVAILLADRADVGATDPALPVGDAAHRLLGLRIHVVGFDPFILVSAYFQANGGLGEVNRSLLATIAQWQELEQTAIIVGGDFNVKPDLVARSGFLDRAAMDLKAPAGPTYRTSKSTSVIDYFMISKAVVHKIMGVQVLHEFPLRPHSPVQLTLVAGELAWLPVLAMPPRLPTAAPYGPQREPHDWTELAGIVEEAHHYAATRITSQWELVQVLDQVYSPFAEAFELQLCHLTDTPRRQFSSRGRPPTIKWIPVSDRTKRQFKSWHSLDRPLHWISTWTQAVLRYISAMGEEFAAEYLSQELEEAPSEFHSVPSLIGLHRQARLLIQAMIMDEAAG